MRATFVAIAALGLTACGPSQPAGPTTSETVAEASEPGAPGLDRSQRGKPAPAAAFKDPAGAEVTLAQFRGRPLLVNLWASWCVPCVKELPTLDRLAAGGGKSGLKVLAVSQDMGPHASVTAFLAKHRIARLEPYQDPAMALSGALGAQILPTTILYDRDGRELWRFVGDLDWNGPEAARLLAEAGG